MRIVFLVALLATLSVESGQSQVWPRWKAKRDVVACEDRKFIERIRDAAYDKNRDALIIMLLSAQLRDDCIELQEGTIVSGLRVGFLSGILEIRISGTTADFFTFENLYEELRR